MYERIPDMCSFALRDNRYCTGDTQKPGTHAHDCPYYKPLHPMHDSAPEEYK